NDLSAANQYLRRIAPAKSGHRALDGGRDNKQVRVRAVLVSAFHSIPEHYLGELHLIDGGNRSERVVRIDRQRLVGVPSRRNAEDGGSSNTATVFRTGDPVRNGLS